MSAEKERLVELLNKTFAEEHEKRRIITAEYTADCLLKNGLIVPPYEGAEAETIKEIIEKITAAASRKTIDTLFGVCLYISVDSIENILKEYIGRCGE